MTQYQYTARLKKNTSAPIRALVRPSAVAGRNDRSRWPEHFTNAIYSDDGGLTWQTSEPFPENGTGEAALAELSDGRIYYNSRVHWDARPQDILPFPAQHIAVGRDAARHARYDGAVEDGGLPAGQVSGVIREVLPAGEIVRRIVAEARATLGRFC